MTMCNLNRKWRQWQSRPVIFVTGQNALNPEQVFLWRQRKMMRTSGQKDERTSQWSQGLQIYNCRLRMRGSGMIPRLHSKALQWNYGSGKRGRRLENHGHGNARGFIEKRKPRSDSSSEKKTSTSCTWSYVAMFASSSGIRSIFQPRWSKIWSTAARVDQKFMPCLKEKKFQFLAQPDCFLCSILMKVFISGSYIHTLHSDLWTVFSCKNPEDLIYGLSVAVAKETRNAQKKLWHVSEMSSRGWWLDSFHVGCLHSEALVSGWASLQGMGVPFRIENLVVTVVVDETWCFLCRCDAQVQVRWTRTKHGQVGSASFTACQQQTDLDLFVKCCCDSFSSGVETSTDVLTFTAVDLCLSHLIIVRHFRACFLLCCD